MKKIILLLFIPFACFGQSLEEAKEFEKTITAEDLKTHLTIFASDEMEGRETGKKGQKLAAEYFTNQYLEMGIPVIDIASGYKQPYELIERKNEGIKMSFKEKELGYFDGFYSHSGMRDDTLFFDNLVFAGYGIEESLEKKVELKEKVVFILDGLPKKMEESGWEQKLEKKISFFEKEKAAALFIVNEDFKVYKNSLGKYANHSKMMLAKEYKENQIPVFVISKEMFEEVFSGQLKYKKEKKNAEKNSEKYPIQKKGELTIIANGNIEKLEGDNVIAYLEGTDKKEEIIVISAHYDHLGKKDGVIYNGADDDGSGSVALIEIAEAFSKAINEKGLRPRRSIMIVGFSGEEKGLLGSKYFVNSPEFQFERCMVNLNIDMIGRIDKAHEGNPNYVYLIGVDKVSKELKEISEEINKSNTKLELDYTYNSDDDPNRYFYRSDHYNFAKYNIPVIFYFNGVHEDYHKPTDTVDKINFEKMETITRLVFLTAWQLANKEERLKIDLKEKDGDN
jgi:hypothetical protein